MTDLASPLPVGSIGRKSLGWSGVVCLIAAEAALFAYLLFSYYYFVVQLDRSWLPAQSPSLSLALPNTVILLLSSATAWWGERGARRGARGALLLGLALSVSLGLVFLWVQSLEWATKPLSLRSSVYGSFYFTITGFHMAHVAVGVVALLMVALWSGLGYFDTRRYAPVSIAAAYWHFVDAVWLAVFATFYLVPRLS